MIFGHVFFGNEVFVWVVGGKVLVTTLKLAYVGAGRNQAKTMMVLKSLVVKRERLVGEVGGCLGTYSRRL
jgi:hypothetical protein